MATHTAGPWALPAVGADNRLHVGQVVDSDGVTVCIAYGNCAETVANARLIAAAPDLLEALQDAVEIMDDQLAGDFPDSMAAFRAAISKAKGE